MRCEKHGLTIHTTKDGKCIFCAIDSEKGLAGTQPKVIKPHVHDTKGTGDADRCDCQIGLR